MPTSTLRKVQQSQGGVFTDAETPPVSFGDPRAEARAARDSAALCDLSHWSHIEIAGADRKSFLHNFCTNDINRLAPGDGCEAFLTNIKGRILAHVLVACGEDVLHLISVPGAAAGIIAHLDRYLIAEDAQLRDRTPETASLCLIGPRAAETIQDLLGTDVAGLPMYAQTQTEPFPAEIRRVPLAPQPAFLLSAPVDSAADPWQQLTGAGVSPAGSDVFNALRIAAGFPICGVDISENNIAQEAGRTAQSISFTKGCYLGQEPIARLDALGHVNKLLCPLRLDATEPPAPETAVFNDAGEQVIGSITSSAIDHSADNVVALAMLKAAFATPDTPVSIRISTDVLVTGRATGESGDVSG